MDPSAAQPDPAATDVGDDLKASAVQAAEELRQAAGEKAQRIKEAAGVHASQFRATAGQKASEFKVFADHTWDDAKEVATELKTEGEQFVRENPGRAILTAVGIGFVVGLLFRR